MKKNWSFIILLTIFLVVPLFLMVKGLLSTLKFEEERNHIRFPKYDYSVEENQIEFQFTAIEGDPPIRLDEISVKKEIVEILGMKEPSGFILDPVDEEYHQSMEDWFGESYSGREFNIYSGKMDIPTGKAVFVTIPIRPSSEIPNGSYEIRFEFKRFLQGGRYSHEFHLPGRVRFESRNE